MAIQYYVIKYEQNKGYAQCYPFTAKLNNFKRNNHNCDNIFAKKVLYIRKIYQFGFIIQNMKNMGKKSTNMSGQKEADGQ